MTSTSPVLSYDLALSAMDASPAAMALFSADGAALYWNEKYTRYFLKEKQLRHVDGHTLSQLHGSIRSLLDSCIERGTPETVESCVLSDHGTYIWLEATMQPLDTSDGVVRFLYTALDITYQKTLQISLKQNRDELEERVEERSAILARTNIALEKQIEQSQEQQHALAESEQRFRSIFLNDSGIRILFDMDSLHIVEANVGAADFYGFSTDTLLGMSFSELTGASISSVYDRIEDVKRFGQVSFTAMHHKSEGDVGYVEVHLVGLRNRGRRLVYSFVVDISDRIEVERKALEQQNHIKALMNSMTDCAMLVDTEGAFITVNEAAYQELLRSGEDPATNTLFDLLNEGVREQWRAAFHAVLELGMATHLETHHHRYWSVALYPVFTESLDVSAVAIYAKDVTQEKTTNEHLKLLSKKVLSAQEDERKRIGRELHDSTAQTISGIKFMLEGEVAKMERGGDVDTERLAKMIELLQGAIVELRHIIMALRPTVLDDLGLLAALRWLLEQAATIHRDIAFESSFELDEAYFTDLQKTVLFRVAQEALSNAVRHSEAKDVQIHVKREGQSCVLYVQDNGNGFSVENDLGSGVGLSSMKERVELVHGDLDILSLPHKGTVVRVAVPVCVDEQSM
ncbi:MAG: PAS domain S-box protein [Desulfovibrionales bacterium]|nr:PAS domain S-box protein [Desulfovibrionales bacterium]